MDQSRFIDIEPPRLEESGRSMVIAGLGERYTGETVDGIAQQWQRFVPWIGRIAGEVSGVAYGVCCNGDGKGSFEYIAGVEVPRVDGLPAEFRRVHIAPQRYAVFAHRGHISTIRDTVKAIRDSWLPGSGYQAAHAPNFERYDKEFDPQSGSGTVEIWIPLKD